MDTVTLLMGSGMFWFSQFLQHLKKLMRMAKGTRDLKAADRSVEATKAHNALFDFLFDLAQRRQSDAWTKSVIFASYTPDSSSLSAFCAFHALQCGSGLIRRKHRHLSARTVMPLRPSTCSKSAEVPWVSPLWSAPCALPEWGSHGSPCFAYLLREQ
jgi:hypothetical protein